MVNIDQERVIEQITKQMDALKNSSGVKIALNPDFLGKVNINITNTKDGLSAQFIVANNDAKNILLKGIDGLKDALIMHGIGVDNVEVKISESEDGQYNQDWTEQEDSQNQERNQQKQKRGEKDKNLFEKTMLENLKKEENKI